ncbi:hypothetical protein [Streptomyces sp. NPDC001068]|uniref:hypothetical protein n=1 Tax=Streptomyces sp. NPDC001068 TaxID=3364544 RepID=UPI0036B896CF
MSSGYGEFDPKFPGISLHAQSAAAWERISRFSIGSETPDPAAATTSEGFLDAVSSLSVTIHELRHFHDFLISDHGSRLVRARLQVVLNMVEVVQAFRHLDAWRQANVVLTPLSEWCRLEPDERQAEIDGLNWAGADYRPPDLPYFAQDWSPPDRGLAGLHDVSAEMLGRQLQLCGFYQDRVRLLNGKPEGLEEAPYYPQQFAEASAILCQQAEITSAWDAETAQKFTAVLLAPGNRYGMALAHVGALFGGRGGVDAALVAGFLGWCLFGNYESGADAFPIVRFGRLGQVLLERPRDTVPAVTPRTPEEWHRLFARWDDLTDQPSTMDDLVRSVRETELSYAKVCSRVRETARDELYGDFLTGVGQIVRARSHMVERFLADPGGYLSPFAYRLNMDRWTAAPLKITLPADAALTGVDEERWSVHASQRDRTGRLLVTVMGLREPLRGVRHIDPEAAFQVYHLASVAEVLIGPCPPDVSPLDRALAETLLGVPTLPLIR